MRNLLVTNGSVEVIEYVMSLAGEAPSWSVAMTVKKPRPEGMVSGRATKNDCEMNCGSCSFTSTTEMSIKEYATSPPTLAIETTSWYNDWVS